MTTEHPTQSTPAAASPKPSPIRVLRSFDLDDLNLIDIKLAQLTSLLSSFYGEGADNFSAMSENMRDNLLWLAFDLAQDVKEKFADSTAVQS